MTRRVLYWDPDSFGHHRRYLQAVLDTAPAGVDVIAPTWISAAGDVTTIDQPDTDAYAAMKAAIESVGAGCYTEDYNLFFRFAPPMETGTHSIAGEDPMFVDVAKDDFRLAAESPARDVGTATGDGVPTTDKAGTRRPQGEGVDVGAFERIGSIPVAG